MTGTLHHLVENAYGTILKSGVRGTRKKEKAVVLFILKVMQDFLHQPSSAYDLVYVPTLVQAIYIYIYNVVHMSAREHTPPTSCKLAGSRRRGGHLSVTS